MTAPPSELASAASGSLGTYTFVDEEELLGFKIWVAELELLVGNARGRTKPDPVQCFQLLQKLVVSLDRASRPEVKEFQRRCEEAAVDVLLKGAPPPVRRLICQALAKLYLAGDQLPLYSRVSSLQLFLGTREAFSKDMHEDVRLGALECMAALYYAQGRFLSIGVQETVAVAAKYCAARHLGERALQAALNVLAAAVEGVGGGHRHAQAVQQDVFRAVERLLSAREPPSSDVKQSCANVLRALGACGGAFLWANSLAGFEAAKALCLAGLGDADAAVRAAFAQALAAIAVASSSDAAKDSCRALEKKPKYKAAQEKALGDVPTACLTTPFVEAASYSNRPVCTALAQAWVAYLTAVRAGGMEEQSFVDSALRVLEMLGAACLASGSYQEASIVPGEGELGLGTGSGERPHAQACALYVLRVGVIEQLGEGGQRLLLDRLAGVLSAPLGQYTPVGIVTLEAMALLLEVLGEVSAEKRAELEPAIGAKVAGAHACLRLQAAAAVAALAVAEPSSAARLVGASLANLHAAREKLLAATEAAAPDRSRPSVPSTPRGVGSVKLKPDMNAVHGWALSGAALVAASRRLPLGVPSALLASVLDYAVRLIREPRGKQAVVSCLELEAGYILLSSLAASLPAEQLLEGLGGMEGLLRLLEPALGQEAATELDRRYCSNVSSLDYVVAMELWWRTAALQAFLAIVAGPLAAAPRADQPRLHQCAAALLKPTLDVLIAHAALQEPARGKGGPAGMFAGAAALLQLRLLEAYAALPSPAYEGEQEALTKLCMRAVRSAATGAAGQMLHSALRRWLDGGDALLGPWQQGRDPLERALHSFEGVAGGPHVAPWQAGSRTGIGYAMAEDGHEAGGASSGSSSSSGLLAVPAPSPYPQPRALGAALLEAQLALVGRILAAVAPVNQAAIMDALISIASGGPQKRKDKEPAKRQAAAMAAAGAALASMAALMMGGRGALQVAGAELAPRMRQLADEVLEEAGGSVALQRAAADLYAASAQLSSDAAAVALVRTLCKEMAETASLPRRAALALAVGSCGRAVGGLSLQAVLPTATDTLVAVARASDKSISVWVMHAMLLLANAAGLAFVPHLRQLLDLAQGMLLSEEAYSLPGLLPAAGRLANASVALLGPDYAFGSRAYLVCKSIINDMRALELAAGALSTDDAVSAALETVLYSQMLVLFAPQAVPAKSHLPVLVGNLLSRQPRLRKAAADTLRHLAERDPQPVAAERVETALFAALDGETDPAIASQIKATLSTLLAAAQLLLQLPELVCASGEPRHTDLGAAQAAAKAGQGGDWLVLRLQQLVDLAFRMASGQLEALRPRGVRLMVALLAAFGDSADPMLEGARLMELYQAQVVSTLRASLAVGAAPSLAAAGASLAAAFLEKGLDGGDAAVLQRLMGLLAAPLAQWGAAAQDQLYAEWVGVRARVALLEAHAHCAALAAAAGDPDGPTARVVRQAQAPHRQLLLEGWMGLLQDYVAVCTQPPEVHAGYRLRLVPAAAAAAAATAAAVAAEGSGAAAADASAEGASAAAAPAVAVGPTPAAVMEAVRPALQRAWPSALEAATCLLAEEPEQAAGDAAAREQHALLLDVCQMALSRAAEAVATAGSAGEASQQQQAAGLAQLGPRLAQQAARQLLRLAVPPAQPH
ncbi:HEAT repeat-containing 5B isoform X2 [Chlorella sorokiniana]|uniref:HEAT repeat-containing 5B isoform X2 n=1 Tax=Chlorella sorokiniana TaxID=3076 RepID=A0A2P6TX77_CHLSO|nr:HEAT repeat-containing 5B isoform X2 [Chlorella sorokiniana]|eukprot:PRW58658.1 HEAT repeat-containing 5B isoform X2 [Chlorella sorokiniana]